MFALLTSSSFFGGTTQFFHDFGSGLLVVGWSLMGTCMSWDVTPTTVFFYDLHCTPEQICVFSPCFLTILA